MGESMSRLKMEKFCLKWNDFQQNITTTYPSLRKHQELFDVTLVTEDGKQYSSHKLILASSSEFFQDIVSNSKRKQLDFFIYLAGVRSVELEHILDYIYAGEVKLYQEDLEIFLGIAQKLKIKGLIGEDEKRKPNLPEENVVHEKIVNQSQPINDVKNENVIENNEKSIVRRNYGSSRKPNNSIVNQSNINFKDIVKDMIGQVGEKWACNKCGKEARTKGSIEMHAEIHIDGLLFIDHKMYKY